MEKNVVDLPGGRTAWEEELGLDLVIETREADRLLGARRAARWFLRAHGWEDLEEQISEVLHSYDPAWELARPEVAQLLEGAQLEGRTGLAILELPRDRHEPEAVAELAKTVDNDALLQFRTDEASRFYVDYDSVPKIWEALDVEMSTIGPLAEIKVRWSLVDGEFTEYASSLILHLLEHADIQVYSNHWTSTITAVIVPQHQAFLAVGVLDGVPARLASLLPDRSGRAEDERIPR